MNMNEYSPEDIQRIGREALEHIPKLRITAPRRAIAQRLALAQWTEAAELASSEQGLGARAPRAIAAEITDTERTPTARGADFRRLIAELVEASERGLVPRDELTALAAEIGAEPIKLERTGPRRTRSDARHTRASYRARGEAARGEEPRAEDEREELEPPAPALSAQPPTPPEAARVLIAPARDLDLRRAALEELAEHLRHEHPAPALSYELQGRRKKILSPESRAEALAWLDRIARAWPAPLNVGDLSQITAGNIPAATLSELLRERHALAAQGLSDERRRALAVTMLDEAEAISREALALAAGGLDERTRAAGLKLALDTLAMRSRLAGLDRITLELTRGEDTGATWTERAAAAGLDASTLAQIGDLASKALNHERD